MELTHSFTVPATVDETWAAFGDIASVASCFPGAAVTSVDGDTFSGTCKVKLGPISLQYAGSGQFVERDEAAGRFVVEAKGKDKRGNGTAGVVVTATLTDVGGSTSVSVVSDLQITGKPAQFGRSVIEEVSEKLLQQFVDCLQARVGTPSAGPPEESAPDEDASRAGAPPPPPVEPEALDLGAALGPVLVRTYWRQAVGVLMALLLLRWLVRRILSV